jgi:hypothetical protein
MGSGSSGRAWSPQACSPMDTENAGLSPRLAESTTGPRGAHSPSASSRSKGVRTSRDFAP